MKQEVIKELSTEELIERLEAERFQLNKLKLHHAVSPIENPQKIKETRKVVARILTELRKREIESAKVNEDATKA
jgi:large subunit ribosomal protein L29